MIHYSIPSTHPSDDLKRIVDYLLTFVGDIQVKTAANGGAKIIYSNLPTPSTLTLKPRRLELACSSEDNLSVTLIRNLHLRIFNPRFKAFLPNDPNILEVNEVLPIFKQYHLAPIFRYNHSLVYFAKDNKNRIHLINRHLLEYLTDHPQKKLFPKEFSVVVAQSINQFIALLDRGLIPLSFYQCLNNDIKVINLSGFDIDKLAKKILVEKITFLYNSAGQTFSQNTSDIFELVPGRPLIAQLKLKKFLAIKIALDIGYDIKNRTLIPKLKVMVFLDN